MNKRTAIILFLILIPLSFYAGLKCQENLLDLDEIGKPLIVVVEFPSKTLNDTLYLVSKRWGLTGDHQLYALTRTKPDSGNWSPDSLTDFIWQGDNTIFYQQKMDSVKIWTPYLPYKGSDLKTKQIVQITQIGGETLDNFRIGIDTAIRLID